MNTRKSLTFVLAFLFAVVVINASSPVLWGQEVTAAVVGSVSDSSGAPIKGAAIVARDTERGVVWKAETNDTGSFSILRLPVGTYTAEATAAGFEKTVYPPFTLVLNQTARLTFQMKVGKISETVEVTGTAPILQTEDAQVSTVIDANTVTNLALTTRNYVQLTLLTPGSVSVDPASFNTGSNTAEEGGRPYINGNREQANNFLLDGVDNNQASDNVIGYTPSPDAIGEFNLITQNASAEFGNYNGGIVNVTIKSGTNRLHGDVFEFFRNNVFNANKWENSPFIQGNSAGAPTPAVRWNMFGGTIGGPIIKNKLFFFADYQGGRLDHPASTSQIATLTAAEIGGNFASLCQSGFDSSGVCNDRALDANGSPTNLVIHQLYNPYGALGNTSGPIVANTARAAFRGNVITNPLDPVFQTLTSSPLYPVGTPNPATGFGFAFNTKDQQFNSDQGDIKLDYNISNKDHLNFRFSKADQNDPSTNSQPLLGNIVNQAFLLNGFLNYSHSFSSNLLNEVRFGKNYVKLPHGLTNFAPSVGALAASIGGLIPAGVNGIPEFGLAGGSVTKINDGTLTNLGAADVVEKFSSTTTQFDDVLIYTHGRHVIKTGFQMNRYNINVFYSGNGGELGALLYGGGQGGNYSGTAILSNVTGKLTPTAGDGSADFALGLPEDVGRGASATAIPWHQRDWLFAGFVQDDWRITDTLTVNLGLRYEARTPWIETKDRQSGVNILTGALELPGNQPVPAGIVGSNGFSRGLYNSTYGLPDFQPRFGFAWSPRARDGKMVVRGAFTISSYLEGTGTNLRDPLNQPYSAPQVETGNVATGTPTYTTTTAFSSASGAADPFLGATLATWSGKVQPAVADQWNLSIQQQLGRDTTLQVGYVGQRTTHLMVPEWMSQGQLQANGTVTYPFIGGQNPIGTVIDGITTTAVTYGPNGFGNVKNTASVGNMNYNALQVVLQKRYGHGLEAQVSYTYEKCMTNDDGYFGTWGGTTQAGPSGNYWQNLYNPNGDYAQCYWDAKHVISAYAVYDLPFGRGKQFGHDMPAAVNAVVGNWSINPIFSWHSGFPLSLYGPSDSGTGSPENRPDCTGAVSYPKKAVAATGLQWFSPSSFSAAATGTFGNCPAQGPVIGPGYVDADISLQKNFPISESKKLQFRADFLNAFNHPNFAVPNDSFGSATFGVTNATQDSREMQFALKFIF
jgi:Carboxypeptidase regulatory-like domain